MSNFTDIIKYNSLPCKYDEERKLVESDLGRFLNQIMNCDYDYESNFYSHLDEPTKKVLKVHTWQYEGIKIYIKWVYNDDSILKSLELHSTTIENIDCPTPFSTSGYKNIDYFYEFTDEDKLKNANKEEEIKSSCENIANNMIKDLSDKKKLKQFEKDLKELNQKNKEGFEREQNPYKPHDSKRDYLESFLFEKYYNQFHESMEKWWKDYFLKFALDHDYDYPNIEKDCNEFDEMKIFDYGDFDRNKATSHGYYRKYFIDLIKNKPERICLALTEEFDWEIESYKEEIQTKSDIYKLSPKYYDLALNLKGEYQNIYFLRRILAYVNEGKMKIDEAYYKLKNEIEENSKKVAKRKAKQEIIYSNTDTKDIQKDLFV